MFFSLILLNISVIYFKAFLPTKLKKETNLGMSMNRRKVTLMQSINVLLQAVITSLSYFRHERFTYRLHCGLLRTNTNVTYIPVFLLLWSLKCILALSKCIEYGDLQFNREVRSMEINNRKSNQSVNITTSFPGSSLFLP